MMINNFLDSFFSKDINYNLCIYQEDYLKLRNVKKMKYFVLFLMN